MRQDPTFRSSQGIWGDLEVERTARAEARLPQLALAPVPARETWIEPVSGIQVLEVEPQDVGDGAPLLFVHGGGWVFGSVDQSLSLVRQIADMSKRRILSIEYSLAPENPFPIAIDEVAECLAYFGGAGHPDAIGLGGVFGLSAGSQIALAAALRAGQSMRQLPPLALFFGAFSMRTESSSHRAFGKPDAGLSTRNMRAYIDLYLSDEEHVRAADMTEADLSGAPRMWLCCGDRDPLLDDTLHVFHAAIRDGIDVHLDIVPDRAHGFINNWHDDREALAALERAKNWLA